MDPNIDTVNYSGGIRNDKVHAEPIKTLRSQKDTTTITSLLCVGAKRPVSTRTSDKRYSDTHNKQIKPIGKQTTAVIMPQTPYFVVGSWIP